MTYAGAGLIRVDFNGSTRYYASSGLNQIRFYGFGGDDRCNRNEHIQLHV